MIPLFHTNFSDSSFSAADFCVTVEPRCEKVIKINVKNHFISTGIVPNIVLADGVYLCSSIVNVNKNHTAITTVLNTIEKSVKISNLEVLLDELLSEFYNSQDNKDKLRSDDFLHESIKNPFSPAEKESTAFNHILQVNSRSERLKLLTENLRISHLNCEEKKLIIS